jgi:predicted metal-dependent peptidase
MPIMNSQQRVTKSHISIMRSKQFCLFAGVLSVGKVTFTEDLPTAATNGRDVMYNPKFIETLNDKQLTFVVLHEALHKVFQHMSLWRKLWKENPMLANIAADYVVNNAIVEADPNGEIASMPDMCLYDKRFANMTTKQVFDLLKQEPPPTGGGKGSGDGGGVPDEGNQHGGHDTHDWEGAEQLTADEVKEVQKQIDQALRQGEIIRGKMAGNQNRSIQELLEPKVDWREQLREFVNATCKNKDKTSWKRPSRRFIGQDIYMPSMIGETVGKLVVGIDTSGSIGNEELNEFLSEVVGICDDVTPESLELIYWDYDVAAHETYNIGDYDGLATTTKPAGGGGTRVGSLNTYLKDKRITPEAIIVLTDGYVEDDWGGDWEAPTLWAITSRGVTSPHGKSIYLGE